MKKMQKLFPVFLILVGAVLLLVGCAGEPVEVEVPVEVTRIVEVTKEVEVKVTEIVEVMVTPEPGMVEEVPYADLWAGSGHADAAAEAFRHWDEDDPKEVSTSCAKCHTPTGYMDFIGADGSEAGVVDAAQPVSNGITCVACHNDVTTTMDSVVMPSGVELTGLGDESRCMQCHQGRSSKITVDERIAAAGVGDDETGEGLGFINIHYYAAAATKYGTVAKGGYEYEGQTYDGFFAHVEGYETCIDCHNPHTLELKIDECQACHDVETAEDFKDVRMAGSIVDYDGDGDMREGVYYEIEGLKEVLYAAMQAYATDTLGVGLVYDSHSYPYFFDDAGERFASWTPRLMRAAYNYQVASKDTGAHAHGGKYIIQLLYDSIMDLNPEMAAGLRRIDHGHFAGSEEAFRHWDEDGEVSGRCSRCHSADGLPLYIEQGVTINQHVSNGFQCATCHSSFETFERYAVTEVTFPSGATVSVEEGENAALCMQCHQGRESKTSVDRAVAGYDGESGLRFINIHYFPAGVSRYGTEAKGAYEFDGKEYLGYFAHVPAANDCTECHGAHTLEVKVDVCANCHEVESIEDLHSIAMSDVDYDGDGTVEGIAMEIEHLSEALYAALQQYAVDNLGTEIVYNPGRYPYFFDGAGERFSSFDPVSLEGAFNFQYVHKDPGAFAHNGKYVVQVLYDSIEALGGDVSAYTRP